MNRIEFLNILESVKPGLSNFDFTEQSDCFMFDKEYITTNNEQVTITREFKSEIEGAIPANELYQFIKKLKSENIEIAFINKKLIIKNKKTNASFNTEEIKNKKIMTLKELNSKLPWSHLPDNFYKSLKVCLFSASTNNLLPAYTCLNITKNYIISNDNFRITKTRLNMEISDPFLLPVNIAKQLINYDPILYWIEDNIIYFLNGKDILFSCVKYNYEYPDIESEFNIKGKKIKLPNELNKILERTQIFTKAQNKEDLKIDLIIKSNSIICKAQGIAGSLEESIDIRYRGPDIKIKINPLFLQEAKTLGNTNLYTFKEIIIGDYSVLFRGENIEHLIKLSE